MSRRRVGIFLFAMLVATSAKSASGQSLEPNTFIQSNISSAKIVANDDRRYVVDISILASDVEQMFQKSGGERVGIDLSRPGALEREIGKFVGNRVEMRANNGASCNSRVEQVGEDPTNDEGVLVQLSFECAGDDPTYDATKLLAAQGSRAWQVVTILRGDAKRQIMVNGESLPVRLSEAPRR
ncbi:MAG TPA: hypothetical protein VK446_01025 [Methylocystis sp.]|nr:hypothetical protein [Methylocystis sp.]